MTGKELLLWFICGVLLTGLLMCILITTMNVRSDWFYLLSGLSGIIGGSAGIFVGAFIYDKFFDE